MKAFDMTLYEFQMLDVEEQLEAWFEGALVGRKDFSGGYQVVCKQIDDFYVEYLKKGGIWVDMRCFSNPNLLGPYLEDMDISDAL